MSRLSLSFNNLAIDIGGANLKACYCDANGDLHGYSMRFVMCQQVDALTNVLTDLLAGCPGNPLRVLVTMTGELCDCFVDRKQGVNQILDAVESVSGQLSVSVWSVKGRFVTVQQAREEPMKVASANWHALATWIGLNHLTQRMLILDTGSTTTDLIPVLHGQVVTKGLTDASRLTHGELIYLGASVTPLMVLQDAQDCLPICSEWFANMHDLGLILGQYKPDPGNHDTPDGQSSTLKAAKRRVLRMVGRDLDQTLPDAQMTALAQGFLSRIKARLHAGIMSQINEHQPLDILVVSGSGRWLLELVINDLPLNIKHIALGDLWGETLSGSACATALIKLNTTTLASQ